MQQADWRLRCTAAGTAPLEQTALPLRLLLQNVGADWLSNAGRKGGGRCRKPAVLTEDHPVFFNPSTKIFETAP
jgi:hypothetical protein